MNMVLLGVRCILATVFFAAGAAKLADGQGSRQAIVDFGLPPFLAPSLGLLVPLAEIVIAFALILATSAWWGSVGAAAMLLTFTGVVGYNLVRGRTPDCHCFGQLHSAPAGWTTLARNAVFVAMAGFVIWRGPTGIGPGLIPWLSSLPAVLLAGLLGAGITGLMFVVAGWGFLHLMRQNGRLLVRIEALEARLASSVGYPLGSAHSGANIAVSRPPGWFSGTTVRVGNPLG